MRALMFAFFLSLATVACTTQERQQAKQDIKEGGTAIGHAVRDASRKTGHFFRDTAKEIFSDDAKAESTSKTPPDSSN